MAAMAAALKSINTSNQSNSSSSTPSKPPDLTVLCSKVTNPQAETENPNHIREFCDAVNRLEDGPQQVVRIVVPKMQSLNEREALYTLNLIEACARSCGEPFHAEIGKFRFLNEIVKLLSPKYLGSTTPERVKKRAIELMYSWSKGLQNQPKIKEAYQMLKQQGLVTSDPLHVEYQYEEPRTCASSKIERPKNPIFDDEDKNKLLTKLLQSKNKEDLEAANRLIKTMVKEDEEKTMKEYKRSEELETIHNNIRLMDDMLDSFNSQSTFADFELLKELHQSLEKFRPRIFQLAAETDEKDESIGDILLASDDLSRLLDRYNSIVKAPDFRPPPPNRPVSELMGLEGSANEASDLLSEQLLQLGLPVSENNPFAAAAATTSEQPMSGGDNLLGSSPNLLGSNDSFPLAQNGFPQQQPSHNVNPTLPSLPPRPSNPFTAPPPNLSLNPSRRHPPQPAANQKAGDASQQPFGELDSLAKMWLQPSQPKQPPPQQPESNDSSLDPLQDFARSGGKESGAVSSDVDLLSSDSRLIDTSSQSASAPPPPRIPPRHPIAEQVSPITSRAEPGPENHRREFTTYAIKPNTALSPQTLLDEPPLKLVANFTTFTRPESAAADSSLTDIVVLTLSNCSETLGLPAATLQVACPKAMKANMGVASSAGLPAQTPFSPPSILTQCLFIHNPNHAIPRLKIKLTLLEENKSEPTTKLIDANLDCLLGQSELEFSDFS